MDCKRKFLRVRNAKDEKKTISIEEIGDSSFLAFQLNDRKSVFTIVDQFWGEL